MAFGVYELTMISRPASPRLFVLLTVVLTPLLANANPGFHSHGFLHGAAHPLSGLDHICAMIAVGLWAAQLGGRAIWAVPVAFVSMMLVGGILGVTGLHLPQVELGIMLSVLVLGLLIASAMRLPLWLGAAIVGVFAVFHGYAHTIETPMNVSALTYDLGFLLSTALLHLAGIALGIGIARFGKWQIARFAGGAIALCGVCLLAGW